MKEGLSVSDAVKLPDGLAVLGVLLLETKNGGAAFSQLENTIKQVQTKGIARLLLRNNKCSAFWQTKIKENWHSS